MAAPTPAPTPDAHATARWERVRGELRRAVDEITYEIWLAPLVLHSLAERALVVAAPDERARRWVTERFGRVLRAAAETVLGPGATVAVVGADASAVAPPPSRDGAPAPRARPEPTTPLNPKLTFDQFVIGAPNHLAHAAALSVAELPGTAYNPLFIYGPPGVGKTHLLQSIATYVARTSPELRVLVSSAERFTSEFTAALQTRDVDRFKDTYRATDVLLIDDVQFLERKARTEEEFFHTFNALYDSGAQLVLTSDRTPADLQALEERLRERMGSGLVTGISAPDLATRLAVLRKRADLDGLGEVDEEVLVAIAERVDHNVRSLEAALIGVVAAASLQGRPLSVALVEERLGRVGLGLRPARRARPTIAEIHAVVGERFAVTRDELLSGSRVGRVAWPRQVAMFLARQETEASLPAIGAAFGGRNHTTVLHAVRRTEQRVKTDPEAREAVRALTELLRADRPD
jgi:chromosomal replication initiator protein